MITNLHNLGSDIPDWWYRAAERWLKRRPIRIIYSPYNKPHPKDGDYLMDFGSVRQPLRWAKSSFEYMEEHYHIKYPGE